MPDVYHHLGLQFTAQTPLFWSMILISVLTHYTNYIIESKSSKKQ